MKRGPEGSMCLWTDLVHVRGRHLRRPRRARDGCPEDLPLRRPHLHMSMSSSRRPGAQAGGPWAKRTCMMMPSGIPATTPAPAPATPVATAVAAPALPAGDVNGAGLLRRALRHRRRRRGAGGAAGRGRLLGDGASERARGQPSAIGILTRARRPPRTRGRSLRRRHSVAAPSHQDSSWCPNHLHVGTRSRPTP